jgi:hypothetical protein
MNTGLQDVANLVWKIAATRSGGDEAILDSYTAERHPVAEDVIEASSRALRVGTSSNPAMTLVRDIASEIVTHLPAAQKRIGLFLSETEINYRHSPAIIDAGGYGKLAAGDRAPNAEFLVDDAARDILPPSGVSEHLFLRCNAARTSAICRHADGFGFIELNADQLRGEGAGQYRNGVCYGIRPDGYIGFRGPIDARVELEGYGAGMGLANICSHP